jgi:hypothetical protein
MEIIRSNEKIEELIIAIKAAAEELPEYDYFGGSNQEEREDMSIWIYQLKVALETGTVLDKWSEAGHWLVSESGTLGKDFGVE